MCERLAWQYNNEMLFDRKFELVSINPGIVFGQSLTNTMFESGYLLKHLMVSKGLGYPRT